MMPLWTQIYAQSILQALKARDPYTYGHCLRVGRYARLLAQAAGLSEWDQNLIEYAGIFHDLGKMGIPDRILLKKSKLTAEEELIMQIHPIKSVEIIRPLAGEPFFDALCPGIRHHHERIDGAGYPDGIRGSEIPLMARILLIADSFDAMTTNRPYRKSLGVQIAYQELKKFSGRQFDPQLVKIFLEAHPHWSPMEEEITAEFVAMRFHRAA